MIKSKYLPRGAERISDILIKIFVENIYYFKRRFKSSRDEKLSQGLKNCGQDL